MRTVRKTDGRYFPWNDDFDRALLEALDETEKIMTAKGQPRREGRQFRPEFEPLLHAEFSRRTTGMLSGRAAPSPGALTSRLAKYGDAIRAKFAPPPPLPVERTQPFLPLARPATDDTLRALIESVNRLAAVTERNVAATEHLARETEALRVEIASRRAAMPPKAAGGGA